MRFIKNIRALLTSGAGILVGMPDAESSADPFALFNAWFAAARKGGLYLPEAMTLATATPEGKPSSRMVLLKQADHAGFVFFTNYTSRKASELDANPHAALLFHWPILQRQVRVEGAVQRVSREESAEYYHSRPRGSQIGAWASDQSSRLDARATLEQRVKEFEARYPEGEVPLPDHWGGYRVVPERMEFWQGRPFRLHDRIIFERNQEEQGDAWVTHRLYP
ncbi:MAG: pyridoxamine 5'-phosphate oxidase [Bacteroidetes bacterium]|nr:pyridoxamine 5'-phosphate oxidase [Bacteroidota bacterium]MDA0874648.1 pyridoxamine 5'-phosphate oxidase [Bacteroidota bacterium]